MLHIDQPTTAEIEALAAHRADPTVSIYLPTTPLTQDAQADRIALKGHLGQAVAQMEAGGTDKRVVGEISEAIGHLVEDDDFWATQANSLAVFASPGRLVTYRLANHLNARVEVSDRVHLKPLLRAVTFGQSAYVLALGIGACRVIAVSADAPAEELSVQGLPKNFNDALGKRSHLEQGTMGRSGAMSEHALFGRYARSVDEALRPILKGQDRPLILAAAEPLASIFRGISRYPHTAEHVIPGSADHRPAHDLAAEARTVLDSLHARALAEVADLFALRSGQGRATGDVAQAARAATFGAIDTLVFDIDADVPGTVDPEDGTATFAEGASAATYDVVDEIARRALASGARLIAARAADIPGGGSLAAILRYAF